MIKNFLKNLNRTLFDWLAARHTPGNTACEKILNAYFIVKKTLSATLKYPAVKSLVKILKINRFPYCIMFIEILEAVICQPAFISINISFRAGHLQLRLNFL